MTQNNIPQYYDVSANILLFTIFNKEKVHYNKSKETQKCTDFSFFYLTNITETSVLKLNVINSNYKQLYYSNDHV